jgi:hypothetical protein
MMGEAGRPGVTRSASAGRNLKRPQSCLDCQHGNVAYFGHTTARGDPRRPLTGKLRPYSSDSAMSNADQAEALVAPGQST